MKLIYVTLNSSEEARTIGRELLERKLANCVNFFPITCIYNWEDEITEEPEVVLTVKTEDSLFEQVEKAIKSHITYTDFIGQISVDIINDEFQQWLSTTVTSAR